MDGAKEIIEDVPIDQIERALTNNVVWVVLIVIALLALWLFARRITHFLVRRTLDVSTEGFDAGGVQTVELEKRSKTLESLVTTLIRATVVGIVAFLIIGYFGLWGLLTGMALVLAALTIAGQSIVLDYMMGILVIVEGTYYEGDSVSAGDPT